MIIKKFKKFSVNENYTSTSIKADKLTGEVTLYRLTSHSVVDLSAPGEYYVCDKADVDPNLLDKKEGNELFLITVKCNADNIDLSASVKEVESHNNNSIVVVKDENSCKVVTVSPYGKI
jgi:hypothetical protein